MNIWGLELKLKKAREMLKRFLSKPKNEINIKIIEKIKDGIYNLKRKIQNKRKQKKR